ncbi:MAG: M20 family peptidase [Alphaproteobacteria bacterium]|nr:M20 family peptidase [Alphaproteobacteria bacterium]
MKLLLKVLAAVAVTLAILAGVLFWRASTFGSDPAGIAALVLPEPPAIDVASAAEMLGAAIRIQTDTYAAGDPGPGADQPWIDLRTALQARYPAFFASASLELVAGHAMLLTWRGADPSLPPVILMAHQDVVPINPGSEADWTHGAFSGAVADGYVWGRGAMDDKGSLIAILEASDALARSGWTPTRTVILAFGHDEEVSGTGAQQIFALLKSRNVKPLMVLDEGYAVLADYPLTGKPAALIGVAEKGYTSLQITATTEGGHSSRPPRESGAVRIARAVVALEENQMPADLSSPPFREMIEAVAGDLPFATRLAFANQWLLGDLIKSQLNDASANAIVRTTTAPTMMTGSIKDNVLPQRASAVVNFRIHPNDTVASVSRHVTEATSHIEGLTIAPYEEGIASEPSPVSSATSEAYRVLEAVARSTGGGSIPVAPALVIGATDARFASIISPDAIYRFAPAVYDDADLNGFHGSNERLSVDNLGRMIRGYAQIIMALCA